jgi:hypothetical protein
VCCIFPYCRNMMHNSTPHHTLHHTTHHTTPHTTPHTQDVEEINAEWKKRIPSGEKLEVLTAVVMELHEMQSDTHTDVDKNIRKIRRAWKQSRHRFAKMFHDHMIKKSQLLGVYKVCV